MKRHVSAYVFRFAVFAVPMELYYNLDVDEMDWMFATKDGIQCNALCYPTIF